MMNVGRTAGFAVAEYDQLNVVDGVGVAVSLLTKHIVLPHYFYLLLSLSPFLSLSPVCQLLLQPAPPPQHHQIHWGEALYPDYIVK